MPLKAGPIYRYKKLPIIIAIALSFLLFLGEVYSKSDIQEKVKYGAFGQIPIVPQKFLSCDTISYGPQLPFLDQVCISRSRRPFQQLYFHAIFDFQRPSSLPLFLNQVCRAMALCIPKQNFRIILHLPQNSLKRPVNIVSELHHDDTIVSSTERYLDDYYSAATFLYKTSIPFSSWKGIFDTVSASHVRLWCLRDVNTSQQLIFQADIDEFPYFNDFNLSRMVEVLTGPYRVDVAYGYLEDRLPIDGRLTNLTMTSNLDHDYPLICPLKQTLEKAAARKVVLYRALFRPAVGNHQIICGEARQSNISTCSRKLRNHVMSEYFPVLERLPYKFPVKQRIRIDHFKFTWGVDEYLATRVKDFKSAGIPWHTESSSVLQHMAGHGGRICIECPELQCKNASPTIFN